MAQIISATGAEGLEIYTPNSKELIFGTNATERMRITSGGNVFINNPSGVSLNGLTNFLSVSSTTYNLFDISRFSDNAFGPNFYLVKSRNGTIGGNTIVASGDNLGNITWLGANGTGFTDAASIRAEVDGSPGASNDMPGRLVFSTTADGSSNPTERMRITSIGTLLMNATTISNNNAVFGTSNNGGYQYFSGNLANGEKFGSQGGTYLQGFYFISWYSTSGRGYAIYATVSPAANAGTVLVSSGGWAAASATYNASSAISLAYDGSLRGPILSNNTGTTVTFYSYVFGGS
jgi:hypothetical protein